MTTTAPPAPFHHRWRLFGGAAAVAVCLAAGCGSSSPAPGAPTTGTGPTSTGFGDPSTGAGGAATTNSLTQGVSGTTIASGSAKAP